MKIMVTLRDADGTPLDFVEIIATETTEESQIQQAIRTIAARCVVEAGDSFHIKEYLR